jgi:hypothetical protein
VEHANGRLFWRCARRARLTDWLMKCELFWPFTGSNSVPPWFHSPTCLRHSILFVVLAEPNPAHPLQSHIQTVTQLHNDRVHVMSAVVSKERSYHRLSQYVLFVVFSPTSANDHDRHSASSTASLEWSASRTLYFFGTSSHTKDFSGWATCRASSPGNKGSLLIRREGTLGRAT